MAPIVRGADVGCLDPAPQSAGLLAMSPGLSYSFQDDHEMLRRRMVLCDTLCAWARDLQDETQGSPPAG